MSNSLYSPAKTPFAKRTTPATYDSVTKILFPEVVLENGVQQEPTVQSKALKFIQDALVTLKIDKDDLLTIKSIETKSKVLEEIKKLDNGKKNVERIGLNVDIIYWKIFDNNVKSEEPGKSNSRESTVPRPILTATKIPEFIQEFAYYLYHLDISDDQVSWHKHLVTTLSVQKEKTCAQNMLDYLGRVPEIETRKWKDVVGNLYQMCTGATMTDFKETLKEKLRIKMPWNIKEWINRFRRFTNYFVVEKMQDVEEIMNIFINHFPGFLRQSITSFLAMKGVYFEKIQLKKDSKFTFNDLYESVEIVISTFGGADATFLSAAEFVHATKDKSLGSKDWAQKRVRENDNSPAPKRAKNYNTLDENKAKAKKCKFCPNLTNHKSEECKNLKRQKEYFDKHE
jgi:hypothetical protein